MAALTAALMALGTASTFAAQRGAAKSAKSQGNYEGALSDMNATLADLQASDALARGNEAANRQRTATGQLVSSQRASLAGSGVDITSGSAVDVQTEAKYFGALDELTIRNNAKREAWGFGVQAANDRAQGVLARAAGRNTARSLNAAATGTLLTGGAQLYGQYREWQSNRAPPKKK